MAVRLLYFNFCFCFFDWYCYIKITSSAIGLKICAITAIIKKYKKHDKILLLAKLNRIDVIISKALIDSNISHDEFVLINNVLKEYEKMKEEIKHLKT